MEVKRFVPMVIVGRVFEGKLSLFWHQIILAVFLGFALVSCDEMVFLDYELAAKKKFKTVSVGAVSSDVIARLGEPVGVIEVIKQKEKGIYQSRTSQQSMNLNFSAGSRGGWPPEISLMPDVWPTEQEVVRVLVYSEGTVHAYYFQDRNGRIVFVDIVIS